MVRKVIPVTSAAVMCALVTACGSAGPAYYLASDSNNVLLVQWSAPQNGQASGSITYDSPTGTAPSETLSVQTVPVNVTINGSSVTLKPTGLDALLGGSVTGALGGGSLTITTPPNGSSGEIQSGTLASSRASAYNAALAALRKGINKQNAVALAEQQAQQQAQANQQAEQTASNDLNALQSADSFTNDLNQLQTDVNQTNSDLASEKSAAAQGPNAGGGDCYNLEENVSYDATENVEYDATEDLAYDLQSGLEDDISNVRQDISALQSDLTTLSTSELAAPAGASQALSTARANIRQAIATANSDITTVNSDVEQAYSIGNDLATGSCSGDGPGSTPTPIPLLRD